MINTLFNNNQYLYLLKCGKQLQIKQRKKVDEPAMLRSKVNKQRDFDLDFMVP